MRKNFTLFRIAKNGNLLLKIFLRERRILKISAAEFLKKSDGQ